MFTVVGFSESIATAVADQNIAAVQDQHIKTQGDSIFVNEFNRLIGAAAFVDAAALNAFLTSPSLRRFAEHYIRPLCLGIVPGADAQHDVDPQRIMLLDIDEQLQAEFNGIVAGATQKSILAFLANSEITPVKGQIFTARVQITLALIAGAWAFSEMIFVDELPVGNYDIVGADFVVAGGVAFRFVPVGGFNRPGAPCQQLVSGADNTKTFRNGRLGVWCSFPHNSIPGVEILGSAAAVSATYEGYVDLIKK